MKVTVRRYQYALLLCLLHAKCGDSLAASKAPSTTRSSGGAGFGATKKTALTYIPDTSPTTVRLIDFVTSQKAKGLEHAEIGFGASTGRRGLFATKKFKKGQLLCQIPSDCALALEDPNHQNGAPTLAHAGANFLTMYWQDADKRQVWAPYLDTLPVQESNQFDATPDFFAHEELELLEFPRLIRQAKERQKDIATVAKEKELKVEELQFATWLTASRAFCISVSAKDGNDVAYDDRGQVIVKAGVQQQQIRVLVPFIDLANHNSDQPNAKLTVIDPEKDEAWFALAATRPISAGKEIVIAYGGGVDSSSELLLNYGFVPHSNKIDEFMLKKGGDECITSLDGWTTTVEEDKAMLAMAKENETLKKILQFRIRLKESYPKET